MIPLTVIIPFYNSGKYLNHTAESLFKQTLDNIEYIFVNDGSSDDSVNVILESLASFPDRKSQVQIVNSSVTGKNQGIAQARQAGLDLAQGEYVTFCDSDDWVDPQYYEDLYNAGIKNNVQMVVGDHCLDTNGGTERILAPNITNWQEFKAFDKWFHLSLWNRLIRLSLIKDNNIRFYEGINLSEDYNFVMRAYYYSKKICKVTTESLYHYNKINEGSFTSNLSQRHIMQRIECIKLLDSFFHDKGRLNNCNVHNIEKYNAKDALLGLDDFKTWKTTFPEISFRVISDTKRNWLYKTVYLLGQYGSWRVLWLYHYLHKKIKSS